MTPDGFLAAAAAARERIRPHALYTPLYRSAALSAGLGLEVFLKAEHLQPTGSFKLRGALNAVLGLSPEARSRGVVAASTGNHGQAVAFAARVVGCPATVFVPAGANPGKLEGIAALGGVVVEGGANCLDAEVRARQEARSRGATFISPYNDPSVVAGQATVAAELLEQAPGLASVYVAVGGGGLIGGIASYLKARAPHVEVVGCQPAASQVMYQSVLAGHVVDLDQAPTLSEGTAGGVEADTVTFEPARRCVDRWILVEEAEIADALRRLWRAEHWVVEGAAGVPLAALARDPQRRGPAAVVLCGRNADDRVLELLRAPALSQN